MQTKMLLNYLVWFVAFTLLQLSATMKLEDLHKFRQFIICDKAESVMAALPQGQGLSLMMVVTSPTKPELNGIVVNSSNILQGLLTLKLSLTIKDHNYFASTAEPPPQELGSSEVPLEDFSDVFLLRKNGSDQGLETATSLMFSNDGKTWISVEIAPVLWHFFDKSSGYTNQAIAIVKLDALKGKITCTGETLVKNNDGVNYGMLFDRDLDQGDEKENRPVVFTWFIPK